MAGTQVGLGRRLLMGMSGQAFSRGANAVYTIALVPLLIRFWGLQGFGEWIALTALISYATQSNLGLGSTAGNEVIMAVGAGDAARAQRGYAMAFNVALYVVLPILVVLGIAAYWLPFAEFLKLSKISNREADLVAFLLLGQIWFGTLRGIQASLLFARGLYGRVYFLEGTLRSLELALIGGVLFVFDGQPVSVAAVMLGIQMLECCIFVGLTRGLYPWARLSLGTFDLQWLRGQIKPGIGFGLSNLTTQSVLLQGPRVILSAIAGGQAVAIYSVYTTITRLLDQTVLLFAQPLEIEVAQCSERGELKRAYQLITFGTQFAWFSFAAIAAVLMIFGPLIFGLWTGGRIGFSRDLMALFLGVSAAAQVGRISAHALIGTNRMYGPAALMLPAALLSLGIGSLLAVPFGVPGMVVGAILGELAVSLIAIRAMAGWLGESGTGFLRDLFRFELVARNIGLVTSRFGFRRR